MTATTYPPRTGPITPGMLVWGVLLAGFLLVGALAFYQVFSQGLIVTDLSNAVPWGLWITLDLAAIALGAGAFALSAFVYLLRLERFRPIVRLALLIGIIGYTSALLTLVADIGRPDRFWHPWVYWNMHSVLWEITWCITIYLIILMVEFAPVIFESPLLARWPRLARLGRQLHRLAPALAAAGLLISLLHQSSLGATYGILKARPIWFNPSMPIMFIVSAIAVGPAVTMATALVLEWVTGRRSVPHAALRAIARFSGLTLLTYGYLRFWDLAVVGYYARTPGVASAMSMLSDFTPYNFGFWVGEFLLGLVVPVLLFLLPRFNRNPLNLVVGGSLAALGLVVNRWNVTVSGLLVPLNYSPGTAVQLEAGSYAPTVVEWGVALGVIGYALFVLTLGLRILPLFGSEKQPTTG